MLQIVSDNSLIQEVCIRRHATSELEADEIFTQADDYTVVPVDRNNMPYAECRDELSEDVRPSMKEFRASGCFRLSVYNFGGNEDVPFVGFSIEKVVTDQDLYIDGSVRVLDPTKNTLTKPAIAVVPLLQVFNKEVEIEAKRASALIAQASGKGGNVTSLNAERDKRMMEAALNATHNVTLALYGHKEEENVKQPSIGKGCLSEKLSQTLDAKSAFYDVLMERMQILFEPSIRGLANRVALGRFENKLITARPV